MTQEELKEVGIDFEQELYKAFGQVKDFSLGMRIAKYFFELGFRLQNKWKPSDEQIEALDFAADCIVPAEFCLKRKELKELLEQLKKLKG